MLLVPEAAWMAMLNEFARHDTHVERVAYLDGVRADKAPGDIDDGLTALVASMAVVTTITFPDADLHAGWFHVTTDQMRQAGAHLRPHGLIRLAQVHTHGTGMVDHSRTDDEKAYSQRVGAVSVVLAYHGKGQRELNNAAVHVRDRDRWRRLVGDELYAAVRFVPSYIDHRDQSCLTSLTATLAPPEGSSAASETPSLRRWWSRLRPR